MIYNKMTQNIMMIGSLTITTLSYATTSSTNENMALLTISHGQSFCLMQSAYACLLTLTAGSGIAHTVTLFNNSSTITAYNVQAALPPNLEDISQDASNCIQLSPRSSCTLSFLPGNTTHPPTVIPISGFMSNTATFTLQVVASPPPLPNCTQAITSTLTMTNPYNQSLEINYIMIGGGGGAADSNSGTDCKGPGGGGGSSALLVNGTGSFANGGNGGSQGCGMTTNPYGTSGVENTGFLVLPSDAVLTAYVGGGGGEGTNGSGGGGGSGYFGGGGGGGAYYNNSAAYGGIGGGSVANPNSGGMSGIGQNGSPGTMYNGGDGNGQDGMAGGGMGPNGGQGNIIGEGIVGGGGGGYGGGGEGQDGFGAGGGSSGANGAGTTYGGIGAIALSQIVPNTFILPSNAGAGGTNAGQGGNAGLIIIQYYAPNGMCMF